MIYFIPHQFNTLHLKNFLRDVLHIPIGNFSDSDSDYESENKIHTRHTIIIRSLIYIYIKYNGGGTACPVSSCVLRCTSRHPLTRVGWPRRAGPASSGSAEA